MRKPILSKCDTCKLPKPGKDYRRDTLKNRHGSCIICEDMLKVLKDQRRSAAVVKKALYNAALYGVKTGRTSSKSAKSAKSGRDPQPIPQTRWIGGGYPGAQA